MSSAVGPSEASSQAVPGKFSQAMFQHANAQFDKCFDHAPLLATFLTVGAGALAACFTTISPLGGAIFGLGQSVVKYGVSWICAPNTMVGKVAKYALSLIAGTLAGFAVLLAVGVPLTLGAAVGLALGSSAFVVAMDVATALFVGCVAAVDVGPISPNRNENIPQQQATRV